MFYIFHGDDEHSKNEYISDRLSKLGDPAMLELNTTKFDGLISMQELRQACDVYPFLAPKRIVIVNNLFSAKPNKEFVEQLLAYLPNSPDLTNLIFNENKALRDSHPLIRLARKEENGYEKVFARPEGSKVDQWIFQRVESIGGSISPQAANLLATNVGNDLQVLANEIEKLVAYRASGEEMIIPEDVLLLSPYAAEANIFDLVDALGNRNGKKASLLLQSKINEGIDPFYLFSMFIRQFRLLIQVKELSEEGYRQQGIANELKVHSFVVGKLFQQARGFSLPELEKIYQHLLEVDIEVKTGRNDLMTALHLLVAKLTIIT